MSMKCEMIPYPQNLPGVQTLSYQDRNLRMLHNQQPQQPPALLHLRDDRDNA